METNCENLISLQRTNGLPHKAMAEVFGVSPKTWGKISRGENWKNGIPKNHIGTATDFIQKHNGHDLEAQPTPSEPESESIDTTTSDGADAQGIAPPVTDDADADDAQLAAMLDDIDDAVADDVDTGAVLDEMTVYVHKEIADMNEKPSVGDVHKLMETLVWDGATPLIGMVVVDELAEKFNFRKGDLNKQWRSLEKALTTENRKRAEQAKQDAKAAVVEGTGKEEPMTEVERAATYAQFGVDSDVMAVAKKPNILNYVVEVLHTGGLAGERDAVELIYLAATARVLDKPIHPLIAGTSGGGKSEITDRTLKLFPGEDVIFRTSLSAKALFYRTGHLEHRVLYLAEASQLENDDNNDMAATVRELQSRGMVVHEVTETDSETGEKYTIEYECKGPTTLVLTTTATTLHSENETRMLRLHITETKKHTRNVFRAMGKKAAGHIAGNDDVVEVLQNFQRWIAAGPRDVCIPFSPALMELVPTDAVAMRRSIGHMLQLICAHAVLHQKSREIEDDVVMATLGDYEAIRAIITRSMAESVGKAPTESVATLVRYIYDALDAQEDAAKKPTVKKPAGHRAAVSMVAHQRNDVPTIALSRVDLAQVMGTNPKSAYRNITAAIQAGYIENRENIKGRTAKWARGNNILGTYDPDTFLPTVAEVSAALGTGS